MKKVPTATPANPSTTTPRPKPPEPTCPACIFYDEVFLQCRKGTPRPEKSKSDPNEIFGSWPTTSHHDKCGRGMFRGRLHVHDDLGRKYKIHVILWTLRDYFTWVTDQAQQKLNDFVVFNRGASA